MSEVSMTSINSEETYITNLELSLQPGNLKFEFSGKVSVFQIKSILDKFTNIMNISNAMNLPELKDNDNDLDVNDLDDNNLDDNGLDDNNSNNNNSDDDIPDLVDLPISNHIENQNISSIIYPVRGEIMYMDNLENSRETVLNGWRTFSSIMIKSSNQIPLNVNNPLHYRVVFPSVSVKFPEISVQSVVLPVEFQGHSYPVCSCPSYYFNNRIFVSSTRVHNGLCKHIKEALASAQIQWDIINWSNRPDNLPYLLKEEGLIEYQWIRSPTPNM
jgi:hypothetical protein